MQELLRHTNIEFYHKYRLHRFSGNLITYFTGDGTAFCVCCSDVYLPHADFLRFASKHSCIHVYIVHGAQRTIALVQ